MEISQIKADLSIKTVLIAYQLTPDRNHRLCCPWHNDKTPSLQIYPKTNTWTCFSSNCNAGSGDVIDFIMKYESINKHEAIVKAKTMLGVNTSLSRIAILSKYYQSALHAMARSTKGKAYASQRNLNHEKLQIGYCGYDVGKSWNKDLQKSAEQLGLYKIKNCILFPMKNEKGQVVSIYGRSISDKANAKHFYLQGGFKGLYPNYPSPATKRLILTESIIDAATIKQCTNETVLALYGTNGLTEAHMQCIKTLPELEEIVLFFDGDEAGKAATKKYYDIIKELRKDMKISVATCIEGEDPNSLLDSHTETIIEELIKQRTYLTTTQIKPTGELHTNNPELLHYKAAPLQITILGGIKITGLDRLRVTLKIMKAQESLPIRHSLDLYNAKQVEQLTQVVSERMELSHHHCEQVMNNLTTALENFRQGQLEQLKPKPKEKRTMQESERQSAMHYLKDKNLLRNTMDDIARSGIVGEKQNALIAYLAYTSRKRNKPLHIMCLGASGTGKTYLQERVSELIPDEEKIEITSLSDNAFYYFGREELKHKLILIEDLDGAENVLYPLRELQSKRRISKTVTLKDNKGNLKTITLRVEGPVCVSGCTTRERIYEDNANRCILLYIDDSKDQDKRIMQYQQKASAGKVNTKAEKQVIENLRNVQRLLKPIKVVNPYAELIDLPPEVFKPRRTLMLLLSFIETITFYHQWQRSVKTDSQTQEQYIETTKEDIAAAFALMKPILFSKSDELTKASRTFFEELKTNVKADTIFYANQIRKDLRIAPSTLKRYLGELRKHGYIKIKGGNKYRGFEYVINDYQEYNKLQDGIEAKLTSILSKISGPVAHQWLSSENGPLKSQSINALNGVAQ